MPRMYLKLVLLGIAHLHHLVFFETPVVAVDLRVLVVVQRVPNIFPIISILLHFSHNLDVYLPEFALLLDLCVVFPHSGVFAAHLPNPLVVQNAFEGDPLLRVHVDDLSQQVLGVAAESLRDLELAAYDPVVELVEVVVVEGQVAGEHGVEHDSQRPDIGLDGVVFLFGEHFWWRVAGRAAGSFYFLISLVEPPEPEVDELHLHLVFAQQQVLGLEVAVDDVLGVEVLQRVDDLNKKSERGFFVEVLSRDDEVVQLSAAHVLHDEEDAAGALDDVVELNDVGVGDGLGDLQFAQDPVVVFLVHDFVLVEDFDGDEVVGGQELAEADLAESALADFLQDLEVFDQLEFLHYI